MKALRKGFQLAAIPAAALLMSACGGGGGGGGGDSDVPAGGSGTFGGSATKGIIKNGIVTLSQPGGGATGSGRTAADGRYVLSYSGYTSGVVQVCVTADAQTRVVCDASGGPNCGPSNGNAGDSNANGTFDFGEELPAPSDFRMCTMLPGPPPGGVSAPITPFTNVVVQRALERDADAALNEDLATALVRAASEINQLLGGIDVLRLAPVNLADPIAVADASPEALVYAALIAAVLGNSVDGLAPGAPLNLSAVIQSILGATSSGQIDLADFRELIDEAQEQLLALGKSDDSGVLTTLREQADIAESVGQTTFNPEPTSNTTGTGIQRARTLIRNVRNTYGSLEQYEAPLDAFGIQLRDAARVVEANRSLASRLGRQFLAGVEFYSTDPSCADDGNCATTVDGITTTFSLNAAGVVTQSMTGTATSDGITFDFLGRSPIFFGNGQTTIFLETERSIVSSASARLTSSGSATVALTEPFDYGAAIDEDPSNDQSPDIIDRVQFDLDARVEVLQSGAVTASASGSVDFDVVRATGCTLAPSDPDRDTIGANVAHLGIDGQVVTGSQSADLAIDFNMANARSFCVDTDIAANNKPDADMTVVANLDLDGVPDARAVFVASLDDVFDRTPDGDDDRTQGFIANASVNLLQNNVQVFRLQAASTRPTGSNNERVTATVTDSANATMVLTVDVNAPETVEGQIGILAVDGQQVGVIRQLRSGAVIARYDDGTFESLF